ncbi:MAG TPA: hypothetical protein PK257_02410 [Candidatus Woesebacteria bacterium]|nr:hypothetical protein [Candidatus Woesebacteria bacterium]
MKSLLAFNIGDINLGTGKNLEAAYGNGGVSTLISIILKYSLMLAGIILLSLLIFGGITFIMNAGKGDSKKADQGKSAITNAAIGFIIVLLAYTIIQIIGKITGVNILNSNL